MEEVKYFLIFLLLLSTLAHAEVRVIYIYGRTCPTSLEFEDYKNRVKSFWEGRVDWIEYEFSSKEGKKFMEEKGIGGPVPLAIVECFNHSYLLRDIKELNQSIYNCFLCNGKFFEGKKCEPNLELKVSCGKCGYRIVSCGNDCLWHESKCKEEGICFPGQEEVRRCVNLEGCEGLQKRVCNSSCYWSEWGECKKLDPSCLPVIRVEGFKSRVDKFGKAGWIFLALLLFSSFLLLARRLGLKFI